MPTIDTNVTVVALWGLVEFPKWFNGRQSVILGGWAAPGARETSQKDEGRGFAPPICLKSPPGHLEPRGLLKVSDF